MPYKKNGNPKPFFAFFSGKKQKCDDILITAERVIDDYIRSRERMIHKACSGEKKSAVFLAAVFIVSGCALSLFLILK